MKLPLTQVPRMAVVGNGNRSRSEDKSEQPSVVSSDKIVESHLFFMRGTPSSKFGRNINTDEFMNSLASIEKSRRSLS